MIEYHIKSNDWNKIYNFLTRCKGIHADEIALRKFVEAIWYIARTGCQWRLLPKIYGTWNSIYKRYKRWTDNGIWKKLFEHVQIMPMMDEVMVDATIIRAHACSAGYKKNSQEQEALGRSRGGFSTKIQDAVVIADKGYDSNSLIQYLEEKQCEPVIPPRKNRKHLREYDKFLYRERHLIECFFGKIKHFRRLYGYDNRVELTKLDGYMQITK